MKAKLFFVKAFIAMIFMTMTVSVSSCSKDDGDDPEVPVLPVDPDDGGGSQKDALSDTSWKLKSVTGWGEDEYSSYRTLGLEFGSNGKVKETNNGESTSGTYSLSGTKISFDGVSFTNAFGSTFDYKLSGSNLTLTADKGTNMETVLTFTKK